MVSLNATPVLIVGAGPVGLTLALDLASRGIDALIVEQRRADEPSLPRCNQIAARSMEIFRRLGLSQTIRELGLPPDYPNDIVSKTTATGIELSRVSLPARGERTVVTGSPDGRWPTPEHTHRVNQTFFEPVLFSRAASEPRIRIRCGTVVESFSQRDDGVVARVRDLDSGDISSIECAYLVGCDGAKSMVRHTIGAAFHGTANLQLVQSTHIRAPGLLDLMQGRPGWLYSFLNPRSCGTMIAIDGREHWQIHNFLYRDESDFAAVDRDESIRAMLGVGPDFDYEMVSNVDWVGRSLVADKFADRRVFICGDAAHLWLPHGGYGMSAGIADAADLSWMLAATLNGWADRAILAAYDAERQPITNQISDIIADAAYKIIAQRREIPAEIEYDGAIGEAARARVGRDAYEIDVETQSCGGLNFGYYYDQSPIIAYDDEPQPSYTMHEFTESTIPGCRLPHLWLGERRSLYDMLGPDYTLIRTDPSVDVSDIARAADERGVPLATLDIAAAETTSAYRHKLTLVRPDQHVAWRGNEAPIQPAALIDLVRGAGSTDDHSADPRRSLAEPVL